MMDFDGDKLERTQTGRKANWRQGSYHEVEMLLNETIVADED